MVLSYLKAWYASAMRGIESLDREQWLIVLVCVTVAGFMMLRGLGQRRL